MAGLTAEMGRAKVVAMVQARIGSSRFPGKVLKPIEGVPLIARVLERTKRAELLNEVVLATSGRTADRVLADVAAASGVSSYCGGAEDDVLSRFCEAARRFRADVVVRICGDQPLVDPEIIDLAVSRFLQTTPDYLGTPVRRFFPAGLDVEVLPRTILERVSEVATAPRYREHVTLYILEHLEEFKVEGLEGNPGLCRPGWKLTVDTEEDLGLVQTIFRYFHPERFFTAREIVEFLSGAGWGTSGAPV